ncbi:MAG: serpin family protein [Propionibacteriaceae bacterium]|jgi:serpin B|nr:serpin family protein [Propionibacteriaceae bacterium]
MKRLWTIGGIIVTALALACAGCGSSIDPIDPNKPGGVAVKFGEPTQAQVTALSQFGEALFNQSLGAKPNPVISPLSAFIALSMAYDGAAGATAQAFADVLGLSADEASELVAYLLANLGSDDAGTILNLTNSAWLDDEFIVKQTWVDRLDGYHQASVFTTDLQNPATLKQVNDWIKQHTGGLIPEMLESIDPYAVALLVNTLYLEAAWAQEFYRLDSYESPFTTKDGRQVDAWFMTGGSQGSYIKVGNQEGVLLPYKDGRLAFMAIMPGGGDLSLDPGSITRWLHAAEPRDGLLVRMPKFHTEFGFDLVDPLTALGLGIAFTDRADFSAMGYSPLGSLCIGSAVQKVTMGVGEKGTEASAATVIEVVPVSGWIGETQVTFDRPYIYAIVDTVTSVPLFIGVMEDPSLAPPSAV